MTAITTSSESPLRIAARLTLTGRVQGIGMRPAIARFARQLSLTGYVGNTHAGVVVQVEGPAKGVECFEREWRSHLPDAADILSWKSCRVDPESCDKFIIGEVSKLTKDSDDDVLLSARVPQDMVVCKTCLADVRDKSNRRHGYALTSCSDCGPRYSIIERMPYERESTSMAKFPLCNRCRIEFESPTDRRFHAQTNTCSDCGPQVWLHDSQDQFIAKNDAAPLAAAEAIRDGRILALRGLGGYQLLVDATSQQAVERLRQRKRRHCKPFAVMVASVFDASRFARLDETERQLLSSSAGPIVVATSHSVSRLAPSVANGVNTVGLMLPTTPLHASLLQAARRPLVCTSANLEGDPLIYEADLAIDQLRGVADMWLEHDRPIQRPIDDSVTRVIAGRPVTIRLARGYAPLSLDLNVEVPTIALGGHQKTSNALGNGAQSVLGPHIGDLDTVAARQRFVEQVAELSALYGTDQVRLACDRHPDYFTNNWAEHHSNSHVHVQHHHAHIAAGMLEHGWLDRQVIGVAFDGTGYGTDGTIWGGEFLLATSSGFDRVGHLRPFPLPGGERAVREPWRVATALVWEAAGAEEAARLSFQTARASSLLPILGNPRLSPTTTSAGRLFDGIAALVFGIEPCAFEGEAAMLLESICDLSARGIYDIPIATGQTMQLDWRPLVRQILRDRAAHVSPGEMAMRFHASLANAIFRLCRLYSPLPVVLGGGVFQNRILVELLAKLFDAGDQPVGLPGMIPPNDGGLAAGQLAVAASLDRQRSENSCV